MSTEVTSYSELITAIKDQVAAMAIRYEDFDTLCDFAPGMTGKAFGPAQVKRLGPEKLFDALRAAGLRLRVEIDPEQQAKMKARCDSHFTPRQANQARPNNHASTISSHVLSRAFGHVLRKARKQRWAGKSPEERSEHARMIANARWKAERKRRNAAHRGRQKQKERAGDTTSAG
jgi:hypothetical protein